MATNTKHIIATDTGHISLEKSGKSDVHITLDDGATQADVIVSSWTAKMIAFGIMSLLEEEE